MTDLTKGVIEIDGFTVKPGTTLQEMQDCLGEKVRVLELSSGSRLKFQKPYYLTDNIYSYAFNFNKDGVLSHFSLIPEAPTTLIDRGYGEHAKFKLAEAKKWLNGMINCEPQTSNDSCVFYQFEKVDYFSAITKDLHYGTIGGEIRVTFHGVSLHG